MYYVSYYDYLHCAGPKTITYLSLIINSIGNNRPETPYIIKLQGESSKKKRMEHIKNSIPEIILFFRKIYEKFIMDSGCERYEYRPSDTNFNTLKKSFAYFNMELCPKLELLLNKN